MTIDIKHRFTGETLHTVEADTLMGADLTNANLVHADLTNTNMTGIDLTDANMIRANMIGAKLTNADLYHTTLMGANLTNADLYHATLIGANLTYANLTNTDLVYADLTYADLSGATIANGYVITEENKFHHLTNAGSENGTLQLYKCEAGWYIQRECFSGSAEQFLDKITKTHGDNKHAVQYRAIVSALCV